MPAYFDRKIFRPNTFCIFFFVVPASMREKRNCISTARLCMSCMNKRWVQIVSDDLSFLDGVNSWHRIYQVRRSIAKKKTISLYVRTCTQELINSGAWYLSIQNWFFILFGSVNGLEISLPCLLNEMNPAQRVRDNWKQVCWRRGNISPFLGVQVSQFFERTKNIKWRVGGRSWINIGQILSSCTYLFEVCRCQ